MIRRLLIVSLASLTLGGCITYSGDGYYSAPGNAYSDYGDDDGYYGSPGYYGDYRYGNVPRVSISFSFGSGYPYYGYPSYYGYTRCSAWSPYCFGGFYPNYGYGWGGYWPVYGYGHHHHRPPHHDPKPKPPGQRPDRPDRPRYDADGPDRPGHNTDYPIGVRPDGPRPRKGQRPDPAMQQPVDGDTQPIAVGDTPGARPLPTQQRPRRMPLPIVIDDGREPEFRRADWIPPQTPIRQPVQQRPIPVESGGDYVRSNRSSRNTPIQQGQPDRPTNDRQPLNGPPVPLPQMAPQRPQQPARVRAEAPARDPKTKTVRDDGDEP